MGGYNEQQQMGATYIPPTQPPTGGVPFDAMPNPALAATAPPVAQGISWGKGMTFAGMEPVPQKAGGSSAFAGGGLGDAAEGFGKGFNKFFKKKKKKGEADQPDAFEQKYGADADPADAGPELPTGE
jgi:hypothetical protein